MNNKKNIPKHIAIIMDGNGRWAKEKGLPRTAGHREGVKRVREVVRAAARLGVEVLTFFAFSAENWKRPKKEINMLMRVLVNFLNRQISELHKNNIRFKFIGRSIPLPEFVLQEIQAAIEKTKNNSGLTVVLALNYGSRQEIVDATKIFAGMVTKGEADIEELDVDKFSSLLYTAGLADPDLLIRTSGEMRLSNFLLWQLSYAELFFSKKYWPDFGAADLEKAIKVYQGRARRFGDIQCLEE